MKRKVLFSLVICLILAENASAVGMRTQYNFNPDWLLYVGELTDSVALKDGKRMPAAATVKFNDRDWRAVNLPAAWNEDEAFRVAINRLSDGVVWYRKHFKLPAANKGQKVFIEFEGARQGAEVWINGHRVGLSENGVMAFGFDLTDHIDYSKDNVIAVRVDNNWSYRERGEQLPEEERGSGYQWNHKSFNANYGGLPKNVILHCTNKLYQTLPLYSNLQTTGVYTYADHISIREKTAVMHVESQICNETGKEQTFYMNVVVRDNDMNIIREFQSENVTLADGDTATVKAASQLSKVKFWSWGYGYLYHVTTTLVVGKTTWDRVKTTTGIRKTDYRNGMFYLNDRVLQLKGYAQRSSNEWPAVGMSVAPWLSDYSNALMERSNANFVRWMHVTPWKQDVESCDRVGLIQVMPAGDAEKDITGRRWAQRLEVMRDAIIYNRNSPSIIFYESGNESISEEHMAEMKAIRDQYDPHGGRAIGSREMLDSKIAEYGGEMLYINKSAGKPMFATEYNRNEALRKYWDDYSYPFHKNGDGPLYRNAEASEYNMNNDMYTVETVRRWYDYWACRPGTGRRVSSGGANIVFSDSNTHFRGAENYRRSGEVDAMRLPKDAYYAHAVMWGGWVDIEPRYYKTHIVGHWNYPDRTVKDIFVVSNAERVELFVNGISQGFGERSYQFLFTFRDVHYHPGKITAIAYDAAGKEAGEQAELVTAGAPAAIRLNLMSSPGGFHADGADMVLVDVEVVDRKGERCPLADNLIRFTADGPVDWRGGIAQGPDNYILSKELPVECGVNRVLLRATRTAGDIVLAAASEGLRPDTLRFSAKAVDVKDGLTTWFPKDELLPQLLRGSTPSYASYKVSRVPVSIRSASAGCNANLTRASYDDNELSEWRNDGQLSTAWIEYTLTRQAKVDECCLKLTGWRTRSYHLRITGQGTDDLGQEQTTVLWEGMTPKSLGYITLPFTTEGPVQSIRIEAVGENEQSDAFASIVEVGGQVELDLFKAPEGSGDPKGELRIVEVEFYSKVAAK